MSCNYYTLFTININKILFMYQLIGESIDNPSLKQIYLLSQLISQTGSMTTITYAPIGISK